MSYYLSTEATGVIEIDKETFEFSLEVGRLERLAYDTTIPLERLPEKVKSDLIGIIRYGLDEEQEDSGDDLPRMEVAS